MIFCIIQALFMMPVFALDLDSTVNDSSRKNYTVPKTTVQPNTTTTKQITNTVQSGTKSVTEVVPQTPVSTQVIEKTVLPAVPALPQKAYSSTAAHTNTQYSGKVPNADAIIPCSNIKVGDLIIDESYAKKN